MKRHFLAVLAALTMAYAPISQAGPVAGVHAYRSALPVLGAMPGFDGAHTWLNSAPLTAGNLRGKVVLVDFWTYSCINCIRTLPYVRAWADKYRASGLAVVGVHTPEFTFERDLANVNAAIARFQIGFPVAVDSDRRIWQAWGNQAWPAYYLVDTNGRVRYSQLGEGGYDKLERAIQSLLAEAHGAPVDGALVTPAADGEQISPDLPNLDAEETYVGYRQARGFASPESRLSDVARQYSVGELGLGRWGLSGRWIVHADAATTVQAGAGLAYQFKARDLHLVMGPGAPGRKLRIKVLLDGHAPGADHGADIDGAGNGLVTGTRLYQLIRQSGKVGQRRVEIRFLDGGAEVYAFTFG